MNRRTLQSFFFPFLPCACARLLFLAAGRKKDGKIRITIWHQDRIDIRVVLQAQLQKFMKLHPEVEVEQLFKETEELRSGSSSLRLQGRGRKLSTVRRIRWTVSGNGYHSSP